MSEQNSTFEYVLSRRPERLSAEEEIALGRQAIAGDDEARGRLVMANTPLCAQAVQLLCPQMSSLKDDLFAAALEGLVTAAKKFDPDKGSFSPYARQFIRSKIFEQFNLLCRPFRISPRLYRLHRKIREARAETGPDGRGLTDAQVAAKVQRNEATVRAVELLMQPVTRLNAEICLRSDGGPEVAEGEFVPSFDASPAEAADMNEASSVMEGILANLTPDERAVIEARYGFTDGVESSFRNIGDQRGTSGEWQRRVHDSALAAVKRELVSSGLA